MKCGHCPVAEGVCHGESVPRMCQLADPSHPDHDPRYAPLLVEQAKGVYPSPAGLVANFAADLWSWAVSGFMTTTEEERARRIAICESCEFFDPGPRRCKHLGCGCFLDEAVKLKTKHCPLNPPKW